MLMTRKLLGGATVAAVTAAAMLVPAAAAHADWSDWVPYYEAASDTDDTARKAVTVECPQGRRVYGMGGRTVGGDGGVALVGVVPDAGLTSVTAIARARPGFTGTWSVVAAAVCITPLTEDGPQRTVQPAAFGGYATAGCPDDTVLWSAGYQVDDRDGQAYAEAVIPSPDLSSVVVRAGAGPFPPAGVAAIAVCAEPLSPRELLSASVPVAPIGSTSAEVPALGQANLVFGAGVRSSRAGMFITGLGPTQTLLSAKARMAGASLVPAKRMAVEEDEMTVHGTAIGSWYGYPS